MEGGGGLSLGKGMGDRGCTWDFGVAGHAAEGVAADVSCEARIVSP